MNSLLGRGSISSLPSMSRLQLNDDKTGYIFLVSANNSGKITAQPVRIGEATITPTPSARNIGVMVDDMLTMADHIKKVCQMCHLWLRNIRRIRPSLTVESTHHFVQSLVLSRLDYCNSILLGLPKGQKAKFQRVQNSAARLIICTPRCEHITPVLKQLHWLPLTQRIQGHRADIFAIHGLAPDYLCELISKQPIHRNVRSSKQTLLVQPRSMMKTYGDRAFAVAAPRAWNDLPLSLRNIKDITIFKRSVKTHLYLIAYSNKL